MREEDEGPGKSKMVGGETRTTSHHPDSASITEQWREDPDLNRHKKGEDEGRERVTLEERQGRG